MFLWTSFTIGLSSFTCLKNSKLFSNCLISFFISPTFLEIKNSSFFSFRSSSSETKEFNLFSNLISSICFLSTSNFSNSALFEKLDVDKKQIELIKFENKLNSFVSEEDDRKLKNEEFFISKKVGEIKNEIRQLENNLLFFKHVKDDNPMVKDVHKNISKQKENLNTWIEKLKKVRVIRKG